MYEGITSCACDWGVALLGKRCVPSVLVELDLARVMVRTETGTEMQTFVCTPGSTRLRNALAHMPPVLTIRWFGYRFVWQQACSKKEENRGALGNSLKGALKLSASVTTKSSKTHRPFVSIIRLLGARYLPQRQAPPWCHRVCGATTVRGTSRSFMCTRHPVLI
jgi:hypothetical protein